MRVLGAACSLRAQLDTPSSPGWTMQNPNPPILNISPQVNGEGEDGVGTPEAAHEPMATLWVSRVTSAVGAICLALALTLWLLRPEHYRLVLALLTVAMFAAILHSYTFENGGHG